MTTKASRKSKYLHARRLIASRNFLLAIVSAIIMYKVLKYFDILPSWMILGLGLLTPLVAVIVTWLELKDRVDRKLVHEEDQREKETLDKQKKMRLSEEKVAQTNHYRITEVYPAHKLPACFILVFSVPFIRNVLPEVFLFGIKQPLSRVPNTENQVQCSVTNMNSSEKNLIFISGKHEFSIPNPYYYQKSTCPNAKWQCEGHKEERAIFINKECFPYAHVQALYRFDLLISNKVTGTFSGRYIPEENKIIVALWNMVHKKNCLQRECVIQLTEDKRVKIKLPSPEVFSSNYVPVAK